MVGFLATSPENHLMNIRKIVFKILPKEDRGLSDIIRDGIAPAGLHRENFQNLPFSNPNFAGNDPTAYMRTDKSLNEVLLG